jgi:hypothetical protein
MTNRPPDLGLRAQDFADDFGRDGIEVPGMPYTRYGVAFQVDMMTKPIIAAAELAVHGAKKLRRPRKRAPRGAILRPGPDTPRWNKLADDAVKFLRRRGDKVKLARILGISRQRLHLLLKARTACPDAERTLQLCEWVEHRRQSRPRR